MPADGSSPTERLRVWLEPGEGGYWLRDAESGAPVSWKDPRLLVLKLAGVSYRSEELQDDAFSPGKRLALVPEPDNEHDPHAIAVYDAERRLHAGYVPAAYAPELTGDEHAVAIWEFRDDDGRRVGLRVLVAPPDAWIQEPRA
jgi:hypothetical protein